MVTDQHDNVADLLIDIRGLDPDAAQRMVSASLLDSLVRIAGPEDLIAMKVFAGGPQDLIDVQGILQVSGHGLDLDLLCKLAPRYGSSTVRKLEKLLRE